MTDIPDIEIESGIPYSQAEAKKQAKPKEPHPLEPKLRALAYGDSFFIPDMETKDVSHISRLGDRIGVYLQSKTLKVDGKVEGVRTWRRQFDQLTPKRQEKIKEKIDKGEFEPEDMTAIEERGTPEVEPTQDENTGDLFWHHPEEKRYFRTKPGDDLSWMRENCNAIDRETYLDRPRYWVYSNGVKPVCTKQHATAESLEESAQATEVTASEFADALFAWGQRNPDQTTGLRYFLDTETDTPVRVAPSDAEQYLADPDKYVEISASEYSEEDDFDDL